MTKDDRAGQSMASTIRTSPRRKPLRRTARLAVAGAVLGVASALAPAAAAFAGQSSSSQGLSVPAPPIPSLPAMQTPSLPQLPSLPAAPSLSVPQLPAPPGSQSSSFSSWQGYFQAAAAEQAKALDQQYSPSSEALVVADEWSQLLSDASKPLDSSSLPQAPSLPAAPSLPNYTLENPGAPSVSVPALPSVSESDLNAVFGAFAPAMLPAPPSYSTIALNPVYTPSSATAAFQSAVSGLGCDGSASACVMAVPASEVSSLEGSLGLSGAGTLSGDFSALSHAVSTSQLEAEATKNHEGIMELIKQSQSIPATSNLNQQGQDLAKNAVSFAKRAASITPPSLIYDIVSLLH